MEELIKKELDRSDKMFDENRLEETISLLKELLKQDQNVQILWRLARASYQLSKTVQVKSERAGLLKSGFEYVKEAMVIDDNSSKVHCWYAVLLDASADLRGLRERALQLKNVKRHMVRSVELNPSDALCRYVLGALIFTLADLNWFKKKIVETVFAKPPEGTYQEALDHFLIAEETEPNFYSDNKLKIAKCYMALRDYESAKNYLLRAVALEPIKNEDDIKSVQEAKSLLLKLK